jgi:hypothetical protein
VPKYVCSVRLLVGIAWICHTERAHGIAARLQGAALAYMNDVLTFGKRRAPRVGESDANRQSGTFEHDRS